MVRKCSIKNCKTNYSSDKKGIVYGFPINDDKELDMWLSKIPNEIKKEAVATVPCFCGKQRSEVF